MEKKRDLSHPGSNDYMGGNRRFKRTRGEKGQNKQEGSQQKYEKVIVWFLSSGKR